MCLGVPGALIATRDDRGTPMGTVDFGGVTKEVCLAFTPEAPLGTHLLVHAGFAIAELDEAAAQASLDLWAEMGHVAEAHDREHRAKAHREHVADDHGPEPVTEEQP